MDAAQILSSLEETRRKMTADIMGIGEPVVAIDPSALLVTKDDPRQIYIGMNHLIGLISKVLD